MNDKVESFIDPYTTVVEDCERFTFLPRGDTYQKSAIKDLSELLEDSAEVRKEVILDEDEEAANQILALRCMINALRYELKMWLDLKQEEWGKAWNSLVDAQEFANSASTAHEIAIQCNSREYLNKLELIEEILFPPQPFNSPEIIVNQFDCSICGDDYSDCDHIAGRPYWGFFCQRIANDISGMRGSALVENPKDKKARMVEHVTDDGKIRNQMTWEKREMTEEEAEKYSDRTEDGLIVSGILMTANDSETDFSEYFPE